MFEIKLRLKYRVVFISVLCISKVFIFDRLYMIHFILVLGYIDPPNSHFYFSFVLRRESVSKEKKIEERAREREREREMEKKSSNEELQSVLEAIKSSDVSFFSKLPTSIPTLHFSNSSFSFSSLSSQSVNCLQIVLGFENYFISLML